MKLPEFVMHFEPSTIEHLGHNLYTRLAPVIGELVSNSWDADAEKVEVTIPENILPANAEIIVRDYGSGMKPDEVNDAFLKIGRNCRDDLKTDTTKLKRPIMGRKGIGKLAGFGIANVMEVHTIKDGEAVCILLDFKKMKSWPKEKGDYKPEVINQLTGKTSEKNGTEIRIKELLRKTPMRSEFVRKELARRFTIVTDKKFEVLVNGKKITKEDRRKREDCKKTWDARDLPMGNVVDQTEGWQVDGWIGFVEKSQLVDRGVDIFVRGKAAELNTMFNWKSTEAQFARAYLVGELSADFLDTEKGDYISTGRNSIQWETPVGEALEKWGQKMLLYIVKEWVQMRRDEKEKKIIKTAEFDKWMESRTPREQRMAKKLVKTIVDDDNIEPESATPLLNMIKANIEYEAFQELIEEIEEKGVSLETLLKLFSDWRLIEAREHLKLSDGRMEIIGKLAKFVKEGALEVKQIQPLFEENGWLIEPSWTSVTGQTTYTKLLRKEFKEDPKQEEENLRMDLLGYDEGGGLHIVELKRPEKTLDWKSLEQIEKYVLWARGTLMTGGDNAPRYVTGSLIVGKNSKDTTVNKKMEELRKQDIRVETFAGLLNRAEKVYGQVEKRLKDLAPEYSRTKRIEKLREKSRQS